MPTATNTLNDFSAQSFEFSCEVTAPVALNEHKGSAVRGALFNSLRRVGCSHPQLTSCRPCELVATCPVSFLLATVDEGGIRGSDVPRPFVVRPPLNDKNVYEPGDKFNFGLTLFARSVNFLPYLTAAMSQIEREGLGARFEYAPGKFGRGRIKVREMTAVNPLSQETQTLFKVGQRFVNTPDLPVTVAQVQEQAAAHPGQLYKLNFNFLTPTRLITDGKPLRRPDFKVLTQRLLERLGSLSRQFGRRELDLDYPALMAEAESVILNEDRTNWVDLHSYSRRQHQGISLSGFTGPVSYVGRVDKLLRWLIWGQLTHVGKDATKGNGWYKLDWESIKGE